MSLYKSLVFPLLKKLDPERTHYFAMGVLSWVIKIPGISGIFGFKTSKSLMEKEVFGIKFKNPVGLAAGFDKNAQWVDELSVLGFGFVEIGTVTPLPQPGNDKPRLFRLPEDLAVINRMGFNNEGSKAAAKKLKERKSDLIIGGNIGKNKVTPNAEAYMDYLKAYTDLYPVVDYFVVNVSSPNTPGLRELQDKGPLLEILQKLKKLDAEQPKSKPILLKIAPDLTTEQLDDIVEIVQTAQIAGLIATNTTISRDSLQSPEEKVQEIGAGGLSGKPVKDRSTEVIRYIHQKSNGTIPIIGVGGIFTAQDAQEKLDAGASLVQVYTGFIYEGPSIVKNILKGLKQAG